MGQDHWKGEGPLGVTHLQSETYTGICFTEKPKIAHGLDMGLEGHVQKVIPKNLQRKKTWVKASFQETQSNFLSQ